MNREIHEATIEEAKVYLNEANQLVCYLWVSYYPFHQLFGDILPNSETMSPNEVSTVIIKRILETVGVSYWNELVGRKIKICCDPSYIYGIGSLTSDKWFFPLEEIY